MKQLIILTGTIILGTIIFQMMVGEQPDSLKNTVQKAMLRTVQEYSEEGVNR